MTLVTSDFPGYTGMHNLQITDRLVEDITDKKVPIVFTDGSKMFDGVGAAFTLCLSDVFIKDYKITLHRLNSFY